MIDLRLGDCLEVMKTIKSNSIDAIITDPPYGTTACKWDSVIDFNLMWEQLNRIIKPNGAIVLFGSEPFSSALRMSNIKNYKYDWKWNKQRGSNFATVKIRPFNSCEDILVFYRKQCVYNSQKTKGKAYKRKQSKIGDFKSDMKAKTKNIETINHGFRYPLSILNYPMVGQTNKLHNTQKPLPLMEYLIKTYTNENETVLDFTMGSGTTMLACKNLNRNGIGIEMDANYYAVAVARVDS